MKKIKKTLSILIIFLLTIFCGGFIASKLLKVQMFFVATGSMTPTYKVGDLICVFPTDFEKINVGDVISFKRSKGGPVITHRLIEKDTDGRLLYTKGDANNIADGSPVQFENVLGVVKFSAPKIGAWLSILNSPTVKTVLILFVVIFYIVIRLLKKLTGRAFDEKN